MARKEIKKKNKNTSASSSVSRNNQKQEFKIPNEAACSPEFAKGCIVREDE